MKKNRKSIFSFIGILAVLAVLFVFKSSSYAEVKAGESMALPIAINTYDELYEKIQVPSGKKCYLKLENNITTLNNTSIVLNNCGTVYLDLNGNDLTFKNIASTEFGAFVLRNGTELIVYDSKEIGSIEFARTSTTSNGSKCLFYVDNSKLTINSGYYYIKHIMETDKIVYADNSAQITVNGGTFRTDAYAFWINQAKLNIYHADLIDDTESPENVLNIFMIPASDSGDLKIFGLNASRGINSTSGYNVSLYFQNKADCKLYLNDVESNSSQLNSYGIKLNSKISYSSKAYSVPHLADKSLETYKAGYFDAYTKGADKYIWKVCDASSSGDRVYDWSEVLTHCTASSNTLSSIEIIPSDYWLNGKSIYCTVYNAYNDQWQISDYSLITVTGHLHDFNYRYLCRSIKYHTCYCSCGAELKENHEEYKRTYTKKKASFNEDGIIATQCSKCKYEMDTTPIRKIGVVSFANDSYVYNGSVKTPKLIIKDSKGVEIYPANYDISKASGRKNVGEYKYKVNFKNNYTGTKSLSFKIIPIATGFSSIKAATKAFTVSWKKVTTQTTGYQIQYSTDSSFKKSCKTITVSKNSSTSKTVKDLKSKKKYYVRIRTYKKTDKGNIYSAWSKAKSVTVK